MEVELLHKKKAKKGHASPKDYLLSKVNQTLSELLCKTEEALREGKFTKEEIAYIRFKLKLDRPPKPPKLGRGKEKEKVEAGREEEKGKRKRKRGVILSWDTRSSR